MASDAELISVRERLRREVVGEISSCPSAWLPRAEGKGLWARRADAVDMESFTILSPRRRTRNSGRGDSRDQRRCRSGSCRSISIGVQRARSGEHSESAGTGRSRGRIELPGLIRLAHESERPRRRWRIFSTRISSGVTLERSIAGNRRRPRRCAVMSHTITTRIATAVAKSRRPNARRASIAARAAWLWKQVPIPEIGEGEVLFRVAACGICGTDIKKIHHGFIAPPQILGTNWRAPWCGSGSGVTEIQAGRSRRQFSSHSVRHLLLLRAETFLAVRGLQESRA